MQYANIVFFGVFCHKSSRTKAKLKQIKISSVDTPKLTRTWLRWKTDTYQHEMCELHDSYISSISLRYILCRV